MALHEIGCVVDGTLATGLRLSWGRKEEKMKMGEAGKSIIFPRRIWIKSAIQQSLAVKCHQATSWSFEVSSDNSMVLHKIGCVVDSNLATGLRLSWGKERGEDEDGGGGQIDYHPETN